MAWHDDRYGLSEIAGEIFVTSDGEVLDHEEEMSERLTRRLEEGERQFLRQQKEDRAAYERWRRGPEAAAIAAAERAARRNDALAANLAFTHCGIAPKNCHINTWGDPSADGWIEVHIPGRRPVTIRADGTCTGGELRR